MNSELRRYLIRSVRDSFADKLGESVGRVADTFLAEIGQVFTRAAIEHIDRETLAGMFDDWIYHYGTTTRSERFTALMSSLQVPAIPYTLRAFGAQGSPAEAPAPRDNVVHLHARVR